MKVFLNPGHAPNGNPDPGAVNGETGLRECDVALAVGESAESYLNAAGVETELLQSDSLYDICEAANSSDADIFVSIHCNAAEAEEANGTETWACSGSSYRSRRTHRSTAITAPLATASSRMHPFARPWRCRRLP